MNGTSRTPFVCPRCGQTSYHPEDIRQGYCGVCHDWPIKITLIFDSDVRWLLVDDLRHASHALAATLGPNSTRRAFVDEIADQIEGQLPAPTTTETWEDA